MVWRGKRAKSAGGLLFWVAVLYLLVVASAVIYSWARNIHLFDLSLTVSLYVALHVWSTVVYFICAAVICALLFWYMVKSGARLVQKIVYGLILLCVFGCAWFPCNSSRSVLSTDIHNLFAYALVILMALSFVLLLVLARNRTQRVFALGSVLYAAVFIGSFVFDFRPFQRTIFLWENVMIALFFFELYLEKDSRE